MMGGYQTKDAPELTVDELLTEEQSYDNFYWWEIVADGLLALLGTQMGGYLLNNVGGYVCDDGNDVLPAVYNFEDLPMEAAVQRATEMFIPIAEHTQGVLEVKGFLCEHGGVDVEVRLFLNESWDRVRGADAVPTFRP